MAVTASKRATDKSLKELLWDFKYRYKLVCAENEFEQAVTELAQTAYHVGFDDGYETGELKGFDEGMSEGQSQGYDRGYDYGYDLGYRNAKD